jgi:ferredoxin
MMMLSANAFSVQPQSRQQRRLSTTRLYSDWKDGDGMDGNKWGAADDPDYQDRTEDWQDVLKAKQDGTYWSSFIMDKDGEKQSSSSTSATTIPKLDDDQAAETWLDTIASLQAEEVEFNLKEADRADKVRQMQEWGFTPEAIQNTLGVAMEEVTDELEGMTAYRREIYEEDVDLKTVESHTRVELDPDTGEPERSQMVYVDEHTCIGCTNCATIAQSTFYMNDEHGRARVFSQWGDDDETIQIAIETCPVDCIHYVSYEELVRLEIERRDQNINPKARLVSQAEYGGLGLSHRVGGPNLFTAPQQISGNMGARCSNCPTRGCYNCPMYGVGKNPEFERKEKLRLEKLAKRKLQEEREKQNKSVDL